MLAPGKQKLLKDFVDKYPPEIQAAIAKPAAERNPYEWQMYYKAKPYLEIDDEAARKPSRVTIRKIRRPEGGVGQVRRYLSGRFAARQSECAMSARMRPRRTF